MKQCSVGLNTGKLMLCLIQDILDLSQMEADKFTLNDELFAPSAAVTECLEVMEYQYKKKKIALNKIITCEPSMEIKNDKNRYKQVIFNLLGNALKFTTEGHVDVEISYHEDTQSLLTTVTDTGAGIKPEEQSSLFQVYGKMESHKRNNPHGVGFGLNICKKLTEAMGGKITCVSEYGKGTCFTFTVLNKFNHHLSLDSPTCDPSIQHSRFNSQNLMFTQIHVSNGSESQIKKQKILAVDDEPLCGYVILNHIKSFVYEIELVLIPVIFYRLNQEKKLLKYCKQQLKLQRIVHLA
jgi:hypothetical protein